MPVGFLTPSSGRATEAEFFHNVDTLLADRLKEKEALYVLLRRYDAAPHLIAASYVPDAAPVRQKMLFASTRLALVRELGSEHFRETLFATAADELSSSGFQRHDAHNALDAPLTEEERALGEVKRAEQEAGRGTASRRVQPGGSQFKMPLSEGARAALQDLGGDSSSGSGKNLAILKINPETETVELDEEAAAAASPASIAELVSTISATEPRFTFFRFVHAYGGGHFDPLLFFYTCPVTAGSKAIKFRMMYPLMKRAVLDVAEGDAGLTLEKKFEVEEPAEITEESVLGELHPKVEPRKGFSRPRRPGR